MPRLGHRLPHRPDHLREQHRLELLRHLHRRLPRQPPPRLVARRRLRHEHPLPRRITRSLDRTCSRSRPHHMISRSASRAPSAILIACSTAIRSCGVMPRAFRSADQLAEADAALEEAQALGFALLHLHRAVGDDHRLAFRERRRLRHAEVDLHGHLQAAVGDADRRDADVLAHDDGAGALVDDDARAAVGHDVSVSMLASKQHRPAPGSTAARAATSTVAGIDARSRRSLPRKSFTALRHARRGREVGLVQAEAHLAVGAEIDRDLALDERAAGDRRRPSDGRSSPTRRAPRR